MFAGLRSLISQVPNLSEAKAWYTDVLGFGPYFDEPFYVGFNVGGYELGLLPEDGETPATRGAAVTCYWGVDDIEAAKDRLVGLGAKLMHDIADVGGGIRTAEFQDPWGNQFGIIYNPHFKLPA